MSPIDQGRAMVGVDEIPQSVIRDHRRNERYNFRFPVTVSFANGVTLHGFSRDVSLKGFFVITHQSTVQHGMQGIGTVQLGQERYSFPCRVVRQTGVGIGVSVDKSAAMLGYAITTHIFNEISSQYLQNRSKSNSSFCVRW